MEVEQAIKVTRRENKRYMIHGGRKGDIGYMIHGGCLYFLVFLSKVIFFYMVALIFYLVY